MLQKGIKKWQGRYALDLPPSTGVREGLQWLSFARLALLFVILSIHILQRISARPPTPSTIMSITYALLALGFLFTLLQSVWIERVPSHWVSPLVNIVFDCGLTSVWIYLSRSNESLVTLLYLVDILIVSLTFYQRGGVTTSVVASLFLGIVILLRGGQLGGTAWFIYSSIFLTLGFVGGYLSEELLRTTERLNEKSKRIERLTALHEMILSQMPTGLLTVDTDAKINFVNPAGEHILGMSSSQLVGKRIDEALPELSAFFENASHDEVLERRTEEELTATGPAFHRSVFIKSEKERYRLQQVVEMGGGKKILRGDVAVLGTSLDIGKILGKGTTRILLFQEVTHLWRLEEKLKQHEKLAAVGQLAAGIAHEIRNPLAGMSASIQMLRGALPKGSLDVENGKLMDIVSREIDRLNNLITEFLDYVKPENIKFASVDLRALMAEVVLFIRSSKDLSERIELSEKLEAHILASANAEKIKQVVWNLLKNAVQAIPSKGRVEVGCSIHEEGKVFFWVEDNGMGMSEEVQQHLFEPFFTTKPTGTGLGLATAYRIVEAHEGEILVRSKKNEGTRFEVVLKAAA